MLLLTAGLAAQDLGLSRPGGVPAGARLRYLGYLGDPGAGQPGRGVPPHPHRLCGPADGHPGAGLRGNPDQCPIGFGPRAAGAARARAVRRYIEGRGPAFTFDPSRPDDDQVARSSNHLAGCFLVATCIGGTRRSKAQSSVSLCQPIELRWRPCWLRRFRSRPSWRHLRRSCKPQSRPNSGEIRTRSDRNRLSACLSAEHHGRRGAGTASYVLTPSPPFLFRSLAPPRETAPLDRRDQRPPILTP